MENLGKMLVGVGAVLVAVGLGLWLAADKLSWFGRLPGDLRIERPGFQLYAPLMTSLLLSVGLTLAFWLFNKFFR
jgi:H+/Cl- antiporter ClcA